MGDGVCPRKTPEVLLGDRSRWGRYGGEWFQGCIFWGRWNSKRWLRNAWWLGSITGLRGEKEKGRNSRQGSRADVGRAWMALQTFGALALVQGVGGHAGF